MCAFSALTAAEKLADSQGLPALSVGIPLLGSGAGKLTVAQSADALCVGIRRFFENFLRENDRQSLITRVVFVAFQPEDARQIESILLKHRFIQAPMAR
jgi:O-acetyl-ADP-ribose deacetylase (regulator of RNase III)